MAKRQGKGCGKPAPDVILKSDISMFEPKIRPHTPEALKWPATPNHGGRPAAKRVADVQAANLARARAVVELVAQGIGVTEACKVEGTCDYKSFWRLVAKNVQLRKEYMDAKGVGIMRLMEEAYVKLQRPAKTVTTEVTAEDGTRTITTLKEDPRTEWAYTQWFASKLVPKLMDRQIHEGEVTIIAETSEARKLAQLLTSEELNALRARLADRFGDGGSGDPLPAA